MPQLPFERTLLSHPVAQEWDDVLNGTELSPATVALFSSAKVWWRCGLGHSWQAAVSRRTGPQASGCPVCAGRQVLAGFNDFATTHPELAAEWHPTLNGDLLPSQVRPGSNTVVFWQGQCGHEWDMKVTSRTSSRQGCPVCSGNRVLAGFNDLASRFPAVAAEWDTAKPQPAGSPEEISWSSGKKAWWKCSTCADEWFTTIASRTSGGQGCRPCGYARNKITSREPKSQSESFGGVYPALVAEWHPILNGELLPTDRKASSHDKVWWLCAEGHEWKAPIARRAAGVGCPECAGRIGAAKRQLPGATGDSVLSLYPEVAAEWHPTKNHPLTAADRKPFSKEYVWWKCSLKGHEWKAIIENRTRVTAGCPACARAQLTSRGEQSLAEFLSTLVDDVETSNRSVLGGRELDIYIPSKKLAVEYNGLYWHSEKAGKGRRFHHQKWQDCKDAGIQLIQVWEDEWRRNPEQVKRMLAHKLGVVYGDEPKVGARKTQVVMVSKVMAEQFLNTHHVQGYANGSYYLGLVSSSTDLMGFVQDDLLAVLVLKREAGTDGRTLNIIRYATSAVIPGGFTKLLKHAERTYQPEKFITFSDHCVSDGGLYANNGFVADKELPPDYMYVVRNERKHKFGYRLKRFRNDPNLKWEEGLTERELAQLNGLHRIWDAGKTRWVKTVG